MQFGPGYNQGTEKYIRNLAQDLSKRGCDVIVAGGDPEGILTDPTLIDEDGIRLIKLPTFGWGTTEGDSIENYQALLSELKPDVVHMVNPAHIGINLLGAAQNLNIPYFISITDFWWLCPKHTLTLRSGDFCSGFADYETCFRCIAETHPNKLVKTVSQLPVTRNYIAKILHLKNTTFATAPESKNRKQILASALNKARKVICLSKTSLRRIKEYYSLSNCHYIPAGLSDTWFETVPHRQTNTTPFVVGFLGAIAPHKGLHTLTHALNDLGDSKVKLKVAGRISDHRYAKQCLSSYKITEYTGELSESQSKEFLDSLDLLVIPSNSPENQPQVLLEAAARKKPVLASNTPGCAELLSPISVFPVNDANKLKELLYIARKDISKISCPTLGLSSKEVSDKILSEYQKVF
ncbi:glycosyltransferase [Microbulbifer sp. THAF38]|uniref:glycosyltransferase n=1 Tax=Microbulbifer sp. THAF38 TaxID=2587856 RepID=UPI0012678984|nr:glycosyltransferase [Microbulbifer sp. THAF38]QFT54614.1 Glycosyl transferases group 1 [Microbulbifer sp. THAF38]